MRYLLIAAAKDIRRRLADPAAFAIWIGVPLLLGGLVSFINSGGAGAPRATVLLADEDETVASGLLGAALERVPILDLEPVALDEGRRRIDSGDATALLVVPAGFQQAALGGPPAELTLVTNPAEQILPGIVEETLETVVDAVFYAQQIFGPELDQLAATDALSNTQAAALAVAVNERIASLRNVVIPPAIAVTVVTEPSEQAGPTLTVAQLFLPGMLFMSFLFIASGMGGDVWTEQRMGTLRRALATPQSARRLLAGKLVAAAVLMTVIGLAALGAGAALFDIAWWRIPGALAWCVFTGTALLALLTLLQMLASSQRGADMLSSTVIFPLMMLGGSFIPFEAMPEWMAAVGQWTPNGLGVARLMDILYGDVRPQSILTALLAIGLPAAAAFVFAGRTLRRRFAAL